MVSDPRVISNKFNEFFSNIGHDLARKIPGAPCSFKSFLKGHGTQSIFLKPVEEKEIRDIIMSLNNGAPGTDCVTASILKHVVNYVSKPLKHICQLSFSDGHFPDELKIARVIPLFKTNDPSNTV